MERWLRSGQATRLVGVHESTLARWAAQGFLTVKRTPGGRRLYAQAELEALLQHSQAGGHTARQQPDGQHHDASEQ